MGLAKWDPFRELDELLTFNRLGRRPFTPRERNRSDETTLAEWYPTVDIHETNSEYVVEAELPNVKKEDVKISVNNGVLLVQGSRSLAKEEQGKKYHRIERSYGSFSRSFRVPEDVRVDEIHATHEDGLLAIHLPKQQVQPPKLVEIQVK